MNRERALKIVLGLIGLFFLASIYPLMTTLWPKWTPHHEFEQMMLSIYATLGVFLLLALRNPSAHRSLIAFTIWSSLAHGAVMAVQAMHEIEDRGELLGGVLIYVVVAALLLVLAPAKRSPGAPAERASAA